MRVIVQRVKKASVSVEERTISSIEKGYLVLLGVTHEDNKKEVDRIVKKLTSLRIFPDENGKTNLSIQDVGGSVLVVSQFTLYADISHGNRPGFTQAGRPELAEELYQYFMEQCRKIIPDVQGGRFGAHMEVSLINDGPFTIIME